MKIPNCECFTDPETLMDSERRTIAIAQSVAYQMGVNMQSLKLCERSSYYVAVTAIVMMLRGVSEEQEIGTNDENFEKFLSTLIDDIRTRDAALEAFIESQGETKQ